MRVLPVRDTDRISHEGFRSTSRCRLLFTERRSRKQIPKARHCTDCTRAGFICGFKAAAGVEPDLIDFLIGFPIDFPAAFLIALRSAYCHAVFNCHAIIYCHTIFYSETAARYFYEAELFTIFISHRFINFRTEFFFV